MITITEHDADTILKMLRNERESLVAGYVQLNETITELISLLGDEGSKEMEEYESKKEENEKDYYKKLDEYDNAILILTAGSDAK